MVQRIFKVASSSTSATGWEIEDQASGTVLDLPKSVKEVLTEGAKYLKDANFILGRIDTMQIALAGVTDSLNVVDQYSLEHRSVLKTFGLKSNGTIDDEIDFYLDSITEYEKFHTFIMDRDVPGDDTSIHAYIETPKDGRIRSRFSNTDGIRLDSRRNNITYWIDDYKVISGSAGGKSIIPVGDPIEIK